MSKREQCSFKMQINIMHIMKRQSCPKSQTVHNVRMIYEVIEDILPFVFDTKRPLRDIWLMSYKQNNFGCFWKK